ncbi:polyphosphate--glucose phosphotransferase [Nocardioides montaniterrae]
MSVALGVDVGGTGIKAALVETTTGQLLSERLRRETPQPATPEGVRDAVESIERELGPRDVELVGIALPGVVRNGALWTAANLDPSWVGTDLGKVFDGIADHAAFLNDADAAGIAEARFGAARDVDGLAVMVTLGTGIGIALVHDGTLIPNCELGHLRIEGRVAEHFASARAREVLDLSWQDWAVGVSAYLQEIERLFAPEVFVIGGGITKNPELWFDQVECATPRRLATLSKNAGIVGAALTAAPRRRGR